MIDYEMIDKLQHLCPTVDNYLQQELYLMDITEDQVTPQYILNECYLLALTELRSLGIRPNGDDTDLLEDLYTAQVIYYMRYLFDTKTLYDLFKHDEEVRIYVDHLLHDEHRDTSEYVWNILGFLHSKYPNREDVSRCENMAMEFHSKDAFKKHLLAVLDLVVPVDDNVLHNIDDVAPFLKKQIEVRKKLKAVVDTLIAKFSDLNADYLKKVITNYNSDKLLPDNVHRWVLFLLMKEHHVSGEIPKDLLDMKKQHERDNSHHIEYYIHRRKTPSKENLVELILHVYNDNDDKISYLKELRDLIEKAEEHELFTGNERALLTSYSQYLYR